MVCPACMTPFVVPAQARAVRAFDVQQADGSVLVAMSRHAIREAIYAGRVGSVAKVRHDGGKWELIGGYPEFADVFRLLGEDIGTLSGTRKLAGWKGSGDAEHTEPPRFTTDLPHFLTEPRTGPLRARAVDAPSPTMPPPERADEPPRPRPPEPAVEPSRAPHAAHASRAAPVAPRPAPPPPAPAVPPWALAVGALLCVLVAAWWVLR